MDEPMVKISVAAEALGVCHKTLYNWITDGTLKLAHPGFVRMSEARRAQLKKNETRSVWGREHSGNFFRVDGRFSLLTGKHNGKTYKSITEK